MSAFVRARRKPRRGRLLWADVLQLSEPVMNRFVIVASAIVVSLPLHAQEATTTLPQNYTRSSSERIGSK